ATVPGLAHVLAEIEFTAPFEFDSVTTGWTPLGTLTKPLPLPFDCFTVTVNVWGLPTSLVASGAMVMLPSTNVLIAGPVPFGPWPGTVAGLVSRVSETPPTVSVTEALPVAVPLSFDVNVTVPLPATVPGLAHVSPEPVRAWVAPLASVSV